MALRYFRSTGTNWGTIGDWSSTPSPTYTAVAAIPTAADDVIFEAASANCTLNVAGTCLSFVATTYGAKTWALGTNNISVAGGVFTLGTGMTVTGTGTLIRTAGGNTLTSNGVTWPGSIQINLAATHTWGDAWTISGSFTSLANLTINGTFNITIGGSLTIFPTLTSTATYILNGVGSLNGSFSGVSITINTAITNTITLPTSLVMSGGTLRLTSGIVSVTSGHAFTATGATLDTDRTSTGGNKISFYNATIISIVTLQSNLTITNNFTNSGNLTTAGVFNIYIAGNISNNNIDGTATLIMDGSNNATISTGTIGVNLTISKSGAAVVTPAITLTFGAANKTLTMNSSVNFATNLNTLTLSGNILAINNSFGNSLYNLITPASSITLTLSGGILRITNNLTLNGASTTSITFAGSFGWDCNNLICSTAGVYTITLQQSISYRTRTQVSITGGTFANRVTMASSSLTVLAIWTLDQGATQSLIYVNGTRIDSSQNNGQTVWSFGVSAANVSTSLNWNPGLPLRTVAYTFVN